MLRIHTLAAMLFLAGCTRQYVPGDAEPIEIKLGPDSVTYCADEGIVPGSRGYFDHTLIPDASIESFKTALESKDGWSFFTMPAPDYLSNLRFDIACSWKPRRPYQVYHVSRPGIRGYPPLADVNGTRHRAIAIRYSYFVRDGKVLMIDARASCGEDEVCYATPADFYAEMDRLGVGVRQPQQAVE